MIYNCMGYALNIKKWLVPTSYLEKVQWFNDYEDEVYDVLDMLMAEYDLKLVHPDEMRCGTEYVAFRWATDHNEYGEQDFHFMKRDKHGNWSHKRGTFPPEDATEEDVFAAEWNNDGTLYDSKIFFFQKVD